MKIVIHLLFALILLQACAKQTYVQNIQVLTPSYYATTPVDSIVAHNMNKYNIPGLALGLVKDGSIIYAKGYGVRDINTKKTVFGVTTFHTASISKLFTATAIMELVAQNKIRLEDKLVDILPEIKYKDDRVKQITIKNILNHSAGLPDVNNYHWKKNNQANNSLVEYVRNLNLSLISSPSAEYHYSNLGYNILGLVIEKVSQLSFEDYVKENLLEKSGMQESDFRYFEIDKTLKTSPHSKNRITKKIYTRKTYPYTREHAASSTLNASAKELSKWMIYFLETLNEPDNKYSAMTIPSFEPYPYIGLGFQLSQIDGHKTIGHYGGDKGYRSYLLMMPDKDIGLVLLANCDYDEDFRQEILHPISRWLLAFVDERKAY